MSTSSSEDKRKRARTNAQIAVEVISGPCQGLLFETCNISEEGVLLTTAEPLPADMQVGIKPEVKITGLMGQEPVILTATVVRVAGRNVALHFDHPMPDK